MTDITDSEKKILDYWQDTNVFNKFLDMNKGNQLFKFLEGPPFCTGTMHNGHILSKTIKDTIVRHFHKKGFDIKYNATWDTHGLPIEGIIEQQLQLYTKTQIEKFGIDKFNNECRKIIYKCINEWDKDTKRLGQWIDFKNQLATCDFSYMNTLWVKFYELYNKGYVYEGTRVMPYSPKLGTSLSNFEAKQNYKDVDDDSIIVKFQSCDDENLYYLVWTTTPWTLASNMALCVNINIIYVCIEYQNEKFILAKDLVKKVFGKKIFKLLDEFNGTYLVGKEYIPLMDYYNNIEHIYIIVSDNFVTINAGTGIVHLAPAFGADDHRVCLDNNLINKYSNPLQLRCHIDEHCNYLPLIKNYEGKFVKDCDKDIINELKNYNKLFKKESINHSYPFCYRTDTPLIYRVQTTWFLNVTKIKDKLLEYNLKSSWHPQHVQLSRFHNWLEEVQDWNIARERYWGTCIPLWVSENNDEIFCIKSVNQLEELANLKPNSLNDLHREFIDNITFKSPNTGNVLKRVPFTFDCICEGTKISLSNGISLPIEMLDNSNNKLLSYDSFTNNIVKSEQSNFRYVGEKQCIELIFSDGRTLICTPEHKILTKKGWIEASYVLNSKIIIGAEHPSIDNNDFDSNWILKTLNMQFTINNYNEMLKSLAFVRLLGYITINNSFKTYTSNNKIICSVSSINMIDIETIRDDINLLLNLNLNYVFNTKFNVYIINIPHLLIKEFISLDGFKLMNTINKHDYEIPKFILDEKCPKIIQREFIASIFGYNASEPKLIINKNISKFIEPQIILFKNKSDIFNTITLFKHIDTILNKFNIKCNLITKNIINSSTNYNNLTNYYEIIFNICNDTESIINFCDNIGYRYNHYKQIKLNAYKSYYTFINSINKMNNNIINKINNIINEKNKHINTINNNINIINNCINHNKKKINYKLIYQNVIDEYIISNNYYNNDYVLPYNKLFKYIKNNKIIQYNFDYFPHKYLYDINAIKLFNHDNINNKKFVRTHYYIKPFYLNVIKINNVNFKKVYDITVPIYESFFANGITVHNCWFESGMIPYVYYNDDERKGDFNVDFIAEGLDQTRGWFYTLHVLSVMLDNKPAFNHNIINGIVLAEDGKKMSKRLQNYTNPNELIKLYGADALRMYLLSSCAVKAEPLKFKNDGLKDILSSIHIPLNSTLTFLNDYINLYETNYNEKFLMIKDLLFSQNKFNIYLIEKLDELKNNLMNDLDNYNLNHLYNYIRKFIEILNNNYIRLNRIKFKSSIKEETYEMLNMLCIILYNLSLLLSPILPFYSEYLHQNIIKYCNITFNNSVHLKHYSHFIDMKQAYINIEKNFNHSYYMSNVNECQYLFKVLNLIGRFKSENKMNFKKPINRMIICLYDTNIKIDFELIKKDCRIINIDNIKLIDNHLNIIYEPNQKSIGIKFRKDSKEVQELLLLKTNEELKLMYNDDNIKLVNNNERTYILTKDDLYCKIEILPFNNYEYIYDNDTNILIYFDMNETQDTLIRNYINILISTIQNKRKELGLKVWNNIELNLNTNNEFLLLGYEKYYTLIKDSLSYDLYLNNNKTYNQNYDIIYNNEILGIFNIDILH